jgi:hypothetical protein
MMVVALVSLVAFVSFISLVSGVIGELEVDKLFIDAHKDTPQASTFNPIEDSVGARVVGRTGGGPLDFAGE